MQINLSRKGMVDFDASAFATKEEREMLYGIAKLDASMNRLVSVKGMQCLSNLTVLDVSRNKLRSLAGLPLRLRKLFAAHNDLKSLEALSPLKQLEMVDVSHNEVTSLMGLPTSTPVLKMIKLSHNRITSTKGLEHCSGLRELDVDHNFLAKVEDLHALKQLRSLQALSIGDNPVANAPRNVAAIRLMIPRSTVVEGLPTVASAPVHDQTVDTSVPFGGFDVSMNTSRQSTTSTQRVRSASADARGSNTSRNNSSLVAERRSNAPGTLYRQLLSDLDRKGSGASTARPSSATAKRSSTPPTRPRTADEVFSASKTPRSTYSSRKLDSSTSSVVTRRQQNNSRVDTSSANHSVLDSSIHGIRDTTVIDNSSVAMRSQRLLEERIKELEAELRTAKSELSESRREASTYKLQVEQLRETVERQGQVNASLAHQTMSHASIPRATPTTSTSTTKRPPSPQQRSSSTDRTTTGLYGKQPKVSVSTVVQSASSKSKPATSSTGSSGRAPSPRNYPVTKPDNYTSNVSVMSQSRQQAAATSARASSMTNRRRRAESPKRADAMPVPAATPALGLGGTQRTPPRSSSAGQHRSDISISSNKSVSFGGSMFYSPPSHYNYQ